MTLMCQSVHLKNYIILMYDQVTEWWEIDLRILDMPDKIIGFNILIL